MGIGPEYLGLKNYLFPTTSQLNGNFDGHYLQRGTQYGQSGNSDETIKGPLHRPKIS